MVEVKKMSKENENKNVKKCQFYDLNTPSSHLPNAHVRNGAVYVKINGKKLYLFQNSHPQSMTKKQPEKWLKKHDAQQTRGL